MAQRYNPTSPLSREWLSMMDNNGSGGGSGGRVRDRDEMHQYYSNQQQTPRTRPPPHQRRSRQRPASTPIATSSNSWWASTAIVESPSMELEACSVDDGARLDERLQARHYSNQNNSATQQQNTPTRVRFDKSADHAKTREMVVAKKASIFSSPADRILDLMSDSFCSSFELDSPSMTSLEKRMASSPILRNFIAPEDDDESHLMGSDSESEISEPFSPKSMSTRSRSRSFDSTYASDRPIVPQQTDSHSEAEDSKIRYKSILMKIARERNERKQKNTAMRERQPMHLPNGGRVDSASHKKKTLKEDKSQSSSEHKAAAVSSSPLAPLTKMTATFLESIGLSSSKSGSQSEPPAAPLQRELDEMESALAAAKKKKEAEERENISQDSRSTKENGLPASVQVYDGRPPSGIWSQSSSRSGSRQHPITSMAPAPSIPLTTSVSCLTDDASPYGIGEGTKMCVPSLFQKRMNLMRMLKENKDSKKTASQSFGSSTLNSSEMLGSKALKKVLAGSSKSSGHYSNKSNTDNSMPQSQSSAIYDNERKRHAYVAYLERGSERARHTIRLYEHKVPPRFPTDGNHVVVKVDVSTISETDTCVRQGEYWGVNSNKPLDLPIIPGVAFCGTIIQTDKPAARNGLKVGDQVLSLVRAGANARHISVRPSQVVKVPPNLNLTDTDKMACLPETYLSAFQALHVDQKNGSRYSKNNLSTKAILILGGTTAVGRALCELATAAGSETVYATAKEQQRYIVETAGAVPIDRDPHHWYSLLAGKMDLVIYVDRGNSDSSELKYEHIQTLTKNGKLIVIGPPDDEGNRVVDLASVDEQSIGTQRKLFHYNVFHGWDEDLKQGKRDLHHLLSLLRDGKIEPKILERLPLTKVARAHEIIEKSSLGGFVLCEPWLSDPTHKLDVASRGSGSRGSSTAKR